MFYSKNSKDPWISQGADVPDDVKIVRSIEPLNLIRITDFLHGCYYRVVKLFGIKPRYYYFRDFLLFPDAQIAWFCYWKAFVLARKVDVIYASCSPFSSALVAALLKLLTNKTVVVDFRDPWTLTPYNFKHPLYSRAIKIIEHFVVSTVDKVILNTHGALNLYKGAYPALADKFEVITNGFDELNLATHTRAVPFKIMNVGGFYGPRDPRPLMDAIVEIGNDNIQFVQVGSSLPYFDDYKDKISLVVTGVLKHEDALRYMQTASLLFLNWGWVDRYVNVAAKTYEYLATGLPILAELPPGDNVDIIRDYATCAYIVNPGDKGALKAAIVTAYNNRLKYKPVILPEVIDNFEGVNLTKMLSDILIKLTASETDSAACVTL